jgi:hypothetical protein
MELLSGHADGNMIILKIIQKWDVMVWPELNWSVIQFLIFVISLVNNEVL